jgi:hypothetical protein
MIYVFGGIQTKEDSSTYDELLESWPRGSIYGVNDLELTREWTVF